MSMSAACGSTAAPAPAPASSDDKITINSVQFHRCNTSSIHVHDVNVLLHRGSLIDGGANGGITSANDALVLETDLLQTADVVGVMDHVMESLPIIQAAAKIETLTDGPIIAIFSNYALRSGPGRTIHSKGQLESFDLLVDDCAQSVGGNQCIVTNECYIVPLHYRDGLPYMDMSVPTPEDMDRYPTVCPYP